MNNMKWQPSTTIEKLRFRAKIINQIRQFFADLQVLEVETPAMSHTTVTDIHLHTFKTHFTGPDYASGQPLFLMTSPEFHMKRLLAAGSGSIYQICKSFRNEEHGRYHNPEFTMLEWYRVGFDHHDLMDEVDKLLQLVLQSGKATRLSYQQAFSDTIGICPLEASIQALQQAASCYGLSDIADNEQDRDTLLQLLFNVAVEPEIGLKNPVFIYDFPASQAALAKINSEDLRVADRFEVYFKGIELANGFHELDDAKEQLRRFSEDNRQRQNRGLEVQPIDYCLIEALKAGLPACAGIALGVDRLVMLAMGARHINDVTAFSFSKA